MNRQIKALNKKFKVNDFKEGEVYNPYNPLNIEVTRDDIQELLANDGLPQSIYTIQNFCYELYAGARVHR